MKKVNNRSILGFSVGMALLLLAGYELGVLQRMFDSRSLVNDGVVGGAYWIVAVDDEPTSRVSHGILVTRVPLALIEPGERTLRLSREPDPESRAHLIEIRATIQKGVDYSLEADALGQPTLVAQ